ncbi:MAG: TonB-dependent receptor [Flavobacteriales bacterium]|nr:TonB-dependent receptor [Flavobacteriales bacterium]
MKRISSLLPTLLIAAATCSAQATGEIRGRVFDQTGSPVPMAHVVAIQHDRTHGVVTDLEGRFVIKPLPTGLFTVRVSHVGFQTRSFTGVEVTGDRASLMRDIRLGFATTVDTFEVSGFRRPLIEADNPTRMSLLADDFARDPNKRDPIQFIGKSFVGVTASLTGDGLHFRGSRTENMVSFIDGVKVSGGVPRVPPSAISSVSVYTGGLPARYGDVTGGVVAIETKSYQEVFEAERTRRQRLAEAAWEDEEDGL